MKRMFSTFPAMGFEFAKDGANVVVNTGPASNDLGNEGMPPPPAPAPAPAPAPLPTPATVPAAAG
jgi:hypothetical protein